MAHCNWQIKENNNLGCKMGKKGAIGSFRSSQDVKSLLPSDIHSDIFDPIPENIDIRYNKTI